MSATPFIGEICVFGFDYAPEGWVQCNGQLLVLYQNIPLFEVIGTTYGGNGYTTFGVPDLIGSTPLHAGQGPELSERLHGASGGSATTTLPDAEMPAHAHTIQGTTAMASSNDPAGKVLARPFGGGALYRSGGTPTALTPESSALAGGGQPHENRQPHMVLNFCIALQGVSPIAW